MNIEKFRELAKTAKEITHKELHSHGITDTFYVVCSSRKIRFVGMYRKASQFSKRGSRFTLNHYSLLSTVKQMIEEDIDLFGSGGDLETEVLRGMIDTLVHEYGHVIAELLNYQKTELYDYILKTWGNEEEFAEDFMRYVRQNDAYLPDKHFHKVIKEFKAEIA